MAQVEGNESHDKNRGLVRTESYLNEVSYFEYGCFDCESIDWKRSCFVVEQNTKILISPSVYKADIRKSLKVVID